jgi:hypothetical protein
MKFRWWYYLLYPLALPHTLLGLLVALIYRPTSWRWSDGCIEAVAGDRIWGKPGAQTWGFLIYYRSENARAYEALRVHERVHVFQGIVGSVFFMLAYGAHFLWNYAFPKGWDGAPRWYRAYRGICFEKQAYRFDGEFSQRKRPGAWGSK